MTLRSKIHLYKELSIQESIPVIGRTFTMSQQTREKWTPREKEVIASLLAEGTDYHRRIDEATQMM